jgi:hypothetical protein
LIVRFCAFLGCVLCCWSLMRVTGDQVTGDRERGPSPSWRHGGAKEGKNKIKLESDVMKGRQSAPSSAADLDRRHIIIVLATSFLRHLLRFGHVLLLHY